MGRKPREADAVAFLRTPDMALEAYNSHMADFVAIGLGVLINPNFVELIETGKEKKARKSHDDIASFMIKQVEFGK